jgi:hypothetical protein
VEKRNEGSFGNGKASFSFKVGLRRIELANRTVLLDGFCFTTLGPLRIESVDGVFSLMLEISDGAEAGRLFKQLSGMGGVLTGIGSSMESRDAIGMGTFNDSLSGLTG